MRILFVAPHPDDELLAAHSLLSRALATGHTVTVLYLTSNSLRQYEANSYNELAMNSGMVLAFANLPDGKLWQNIGVVADIVARHVKQHDACLVPHWLEPLTITSDHLATYIATRLARVPTHKLCYWLLWARIRPGQVAAPRNSWRKLKWLCRAILPWPRKMHKLWPNSAQKLHAFQTCYSSQAAGFSKVALSHFCWQEQFVCSNVLLTEMLTGAYDIEQC